MMFEQKFFIEMTRFVLAVLFVEFALGCLIAYIIACRKYESKKIVAAAGGVLILVMKAFFTLIGIFNAWTWKIYLIGLIPLDLLLAALFFWSAVTER